MLAAKLSHSPYGIHFPIGIGAETIGIEGLK